MTVTMKRSALTKRLELLCQALPLHSPEGTRSRISMLIAGGKALLRAVGRTSAVEDSIPADGEGAFSLPAKEFLDRIQNLPPGLVRLGKAAGMVQIGCDFARVFSMLESTAEPASFSLGMDDAGVVISTVGEVAALIDSCRYAIGDEPDLPVFVGQLMRTPTGLRLAVSDGYRMAFRPMDAEPMGDWPERVGVTAASLKLLAHALRDKKPDVPCVLSANGKGFGLAIEDMSVVTQTVECKVPFDQLLRILSWDATMEIDRDMFIEAIKACDVAVKEGNGIEFHLAESGSLALMVREPKKEKETAGEVVAEEILESQFVESPREQVIKLRGSFVVDALNALPAGTIQMRLSKEFGRPVAFRAANDPSLHLVSPMAMT